MSRRLLEVVAVLASPCLLSEALSEDGGNWYKGNTHTHSLWSDIGVPHNQSSFSCCFFVIGDAL